MSAEHEGGIPSAIQREVPRRRVELEPVDFDEEAASYKHVDAPDPSHCDLLPNLEPAALQPLPCK